MQEISITPDGIKRNLKRIKPLDALCEYIWNGFDAEATEVRVQLHQNDLGMIDRITVCDNGVGIPFEELIQKFKPFNASNKAESDKSNNRTLPHGYQGIGRLTFFSFAQNARWETTYSKENKNYKYYIHMEKDTINKYDDNGSKEPTVVDSETGTSVTFTQIENFDEKEIIDKIRDTFFWFLELYKSKGVKILVNDTEVSYEELIICKEDLKLDDLKLENNYVAYFVQWKQGLGKEYSRYYFLDGNNDEKYKETTKLNKQSDAFYHSVFIQSDYFNDFHFEKNTEEGQQNLFPSKNDVEYKKMINGVNDLLISHRRDYLKRSSEEYIDKMVKKDIYPTFDESNVIDVYRKQELDSLISALYVAQPKIFTNLSEENKKITVRLLNLIMEAGNKENLFIVLQSIIELEDTELEELAGVLQETTLSNMTKVIRLLEDRQRTIQGLKQLVFDPDLFAKEVPHIQAVVENHYWIFGEQYNLITAAEPDFTKALIGLILKETGVLEDVTLEHEDRRKEMDIFMVKQDRKGAVTENVVVELKRPSVYLGEKELSQVKKYLRVIKSDNRFNMGNTKWTFYLVGNRFNDTGYLEGELESKSKEEPFLVHSQDNGLTKIYVMKWSEVFDDLSKRHDFVMERIKFNEKMWLQEHDSADEIVNEIKNNTASMDGAVMT